MSQVDEAKIFEGARPNATRLAVATRVQKPDPSVYTDEEREAYDKIPIYRKGENAGSYFGALLNSPRFCLNRTDISSLIRTAAEYPNTFSHAQRELVDFVLATHFNVNHAMDIHVGDALAAGMRVEAIEALRSGDDSALNEEELLLTTYIRQVVTFSVTDDVFKKVEDLIGTKGIVEYTCLITFLALGMMQMDAFGCPTPTDEEVDQMVEDYKSGKRELPDFRARIK